MGRGFSHFPISQQFYFLSGRRMSDLTEELLKKGSTIEKLAEEVLTDEQLVCMPSTAGVGMGGNRSDGSTMHKGVTYSCHGQRGW